MVFSNSSVVTFFKGVAMSDSVFSLVNKVAAIYGRPPMEPPVVDLYFQAVGIKCEAEFSRQLLELLRVSKSFPLPVDFGADCMLHRAQAATETVAKEAAHA